MRNLASLAILGIFVALQTGCAAGVAVTRPRLPTIIIGEAPAERFPDIARHPPAHRQLSRGEAIAVGRSWCNANGYGCRLDEAKLKRNDGVWKVQFATAQARNGRGHYKGNGRGRNSNGKVHLQIDAFSGRLLDVDARRG